MWFVAVILALVVVAILAALVGGRRRTSRTRARPAPAGARADLRHHAEAVGLRGVAHADAREIAERLREEKPSHDLPARHSGAEPSSGGVDT